VLFEGRYLIIFAVITPVKRLWYDLGRLLLHVTPCGGYRSVTDKFIWNL